MRRMETQCGMRHRSDVATARAWAPSPMVLASADFGAIKQVRDGATASNPQARRLGVSSP